MSERMLCFSEVNWPSIVSPSESVIDLCLKRDLPVYIKVQRGDHLVYRLCRIALKSSHSPPTVWRQNESQITPGHADAFRLEIVTTPFSGFDEELIFLRLDDASLAELAVSRCTTVSSFSRDGFLMPRPFRVKGQTRGGYEIWEYEEIKIPSLKRVEFDLALLVDKVSWQLASLELKARFLSGAELEDDEFKKLIAKFDINENAKLYFVESDIENLKQSIRQEGEPTPYPFDHRERMPGIYWMFRAAEMLKAGHISKDGVRKWLKEKAPGVYRYKSERTAEKFVWPDVDRALGGGGRGNFVLDDLDDWTVGDNYKFEFSSRGLSYVLACADWWFKEIERNKERGEKSLPGKNILAEHLLKNKFGGHEVGHLVFLIGESILSEDEVLLTEKFQLSLSDTIEPIVEDQWLIPGSCIPSPKQRQDSEGK